MRGYICSAITKSVKYSLFIITLFFEIFGFAQSNKAYLPMENNQLKKIEAIETEQASETSNVFYMPIGKVPNSGITYFDYLKILEYFTKIYPQIQFPIEWTEPYFAAYAKKENQLRSVHLWGGLVRMPTATMPVILTAVCHEIGHHYGGPPLQDQVIGGEWASAEGQADYFAARYCLPRTFFDHPEWFMNLKNDVHFVQPTNVVLNTCLKNRFCQAAVLSGYQMFQVFSAIPNSITEKFQFDLIADPTDVSIIQNYPSLQCRFETYVSGGYCLVDASSKYCQRPACWYREIKK